LPFIQIVFLSFFLSYFSIQAISLGESLLYFLMPMHNSTIQVPFALMITFFLFFLYFIIMKKFDIIQLKKYSFNDGAVLFFASLLFSPVILAVKYYLSESEWIDGTQILTLLFIQIPFHWIIVILTHCYIQHGKCNSS
jgi:hypothetical protein